MAVKLEEQEYVKMFELPAIYDSRKSFYGKAKVFREIHNLFLFSYDTLVASYDIDAKTFWITDELSYHTMTTNRHIREFQKQIKNGDL